MKILAAFDSFKESMTAYAAGEAVQRAYNNVHICPLADGGEGTMEVMNHYLHGDIHEIEVAGPLFKTVHAKLAIMDDFAIIEKTKLLSGIVDNNPTVNRINILWCRRNDEICL